MRFDIIFLKQKKYINHKFHCKIKKKKKKFFKERTSRSSSSSTSSQLENLDFVKTSFVKSPSIHLLSNLNEAFIQCEEFQDMKPHAR